MEKVDTNDDSINLLNIGTQILLKDIMDQFIRNLGKHKTHYATKISSAWTALKERPIDIIIIEFELQDGTAFSFIQKLRQFKEYDGIFLAIATEQGNNEVIAAASELDVDFLLQKPFSSLEIKQLIEDFGKFRKKPDPIRDAVKKADQAFRDKDYTAAAKIFLELTNKSSQDVYVLAKAGLYYLKVPQLDIAEQHLKKAYALDPNDILVMHGLGLLNWRLKNFSKAFHYLAEAQMLSPYNPDRAIFLGKLLNTWGLDFLKKACNKDPKNTELHYLYAKTLIFQKDYQKGMQELKLAGIDKSHSDFKEANALMGFCQKVAAVKND